ncbi:MAG TPA: TetR/AcrR family transcriptional regulator [Magnetospirillaceae bacterium]|jgi:AcrR family transcriptional regulator
MISDTEKRTPGRKRDESTRDAILKAAFDMIDTEGYRGFTIEGVAQRSGAGKTTIYRWWPTKEDLAFDALMKEFSASFADDYHPDSVIDGIKHYLHILGESFNGKPGKVLASFVGGGQCQESSAERFRERFLAPRREKGRLALQKGIASGELRADIDIDIALDALISPFFFRLLWRTGTFDQAWTDRMVETVIRGLANPNPPATHHAHAAAAPALKAAEEHATI